MNPHRFDVESGVRACVRVCVFRVRELRRTISFFNLLAFGIHLNNT